MAVVWVADTQVLGAVVTGPSAGKASAFLQVNSDVEIAIDNPGLVFEIGQSLPLVQKNDRYFVAVVERSGEAPRLVAFPRLNNVNKGTGWITYEREIVFGASVRSCYGAVQLNRFDRLPLIAESERTYRVVFERNGQRVPLEIQKSTRGVEVVREETVHTGAATATRKNSNVMPPVYQMSLPEPGPADSAVFGETEDRRGRHVAAPSGREPINLTDASIVPVVEFAAPRVEPSAESGAVTVAGTAPASVEAAAPEAAPGTEAEPAGGSPALATTADTSPEAANSTPPAPQPEVVAAAAPQTAADEPAPPERPLRTPPWMAVWTWLAMLASNTLLFKILLVTAIVEGLLLVRQQRRRTPASTPAGATGAPVSQVMTYSSTEGTIVNQAPKLSIRSSGDLSGTLDAFSMGQVVQFFSSAGESGTLSVSTLKGSGRDELVFDRGRIIDARCGDKRGEDAVNLILRLHEGSFTFRREDVNSHPTTVQQDTMALLLEAHRQMDEQNWPQESAVAPPVQ